MGKRLNDTSAIAGRKMCDGEEYSISTRQIDNGFVTRKSSYNPGTGEYKSSEMFSEKAPKALVGGIAAPSDSTNSHGLAGTKKYLGE